MTPTDYSDIVVAPVAELFFDTGFPEYVALVTLNSLPLY